MDKKGSKKGSGMDLSGFWQIIPAAPAFLNVKGRFWNLEIEKLKKRLHFSPAKR